MKLHSKSGIKENLILDTSEHLVNLDPKKKIRVTRDIKFFNEFDTPTKYEEFITEKIINGKTQISNDKTQDNNIQEIMLDHNYTNKENISTVEIEDKQDKFNINDNDELNINNDEIIIDDTQIEMNKTKMKRGRGRPTFMKTGKRGRPAK
ncbi:hypothetical protein ABEB36_015506 [Hypothenemus hampei]|uniref:Uncharacterized protein n=1 Tax=Hypothenemus hampei TaxID=57062 RepID=A0ABD1E487_HYPHA